MCSNSNAGAATQERRNAAPHRAFDAIAGRAFLGIQIQTQIQIQIQMLIQVQIQLNIHSIHNCLFNKSKQIQTSVQAFNYTVINKGIDTEASYKYTVRILRLKYTSNTQIHGEKFQHTQHTLLLNPCYAGDGRNMQVQCFQCWGHHQVLDRCRFRQ